MNKLVPLCLALALVSGCAAGLPQVATQTPLQITTFSDAETAATVATKAADIYVTTGHPSAAAQTVIKSANATVRAAIASLRADRDAGRSLAFGTLTAALGALAAAQK